MSKNNYIDNKKFYEEIKKYKKSCEGMSLSDRPRIPNYIGECFKLIATNLANKKNFINYSYKEDMISDGIFDCVRYILTFDSEKYNNPFAYFTFACYMAFVRRIKKEKKYLYTKFKVIDNSEIHGLLNSHQDHDSSDQAILDDIGYSKESRINMMNFIEDYEKKERNKKNENTTTGAIPILSEKDE